MKPRNIRHVQISLEYLLRLSQSLPPCLARRKSKEMLQIANKYQIKMQKVSRILCETCSSVLIPRVTCEAKLEKRECGFGLAVACNNCKAATFTVKRGV